MGIVNIRIVNIRINVTMLISGLFILLFISAISTKRINGIIINRAASLILLYSMIISLDTFNVSIIGSGIGVYGGLYQITVLSKLIEGFIYIVGAMILSNTINYLSTNSHNNNNFNNNNDGSLTSLKSLRSEYSIIALFTVVGGVLLITSNDLISMYLSIELQSFGLYVLATIYRDSQAATSAGLKYFLLGGLSSGFILLGSSIIYSYTGVTNLESIYLLISEGWTLNITNSIDFKLMSYLELGFIVMTVGFLFKIAAAPFHNWAPDVYDGVPVRVTTWLAVMGKISILTFLLDLILGISHNNFINTESSISNLILLGSLLSLLVGTIVGLTQSRIKRLFAYSTISHVGFLLLAIGINTQDSTESFIFYLIQYSLTSANAFFVLIAFGNLTLANKNSYLSFDDRNAETEYSPIQFINQLKGKFNSHEPYPLLALSLAIILFSMAGIPPLIGFFAKQAVLLSAVKNGFIFLAFIGIITSVISAAYYLRIIKVMIFDPSDDQFADSDLHNQSSVQNDSSVISNSLSFSISLLTVLTLFFVLKPTLILNSAHIMSLSLFYI